MGYGPTVIDELLELWLHRSLVEVLLCPLIVFVDARLAAIYVVHEGRVLIAKGGGFAFSLRFKPACIADAIAYTWDSVGAAVEPVRLWSGAFGLGWRVPWPPHGG